MAKDEESEEYEEEVTEDEDIYDDKEREKMIENDEISPEEEGFLEGYEEKEEVSEDEEYSE